MYFNRHGDNLDLVVLIRPMGGGGGGSNDTPSVRVPATRILKELPCFGVIFSNIHPASESSFLPRIFSGGGGRG